MKKILILGTIITFLLTINFESKTLLNKENIKDTTLEEKIGFIDIKEIMVKSEIKEGTTNDILNQNVVGHIKESSLSFNKTVILAAHNDTVFLGLDRLKKGSVIELTLYGIKNEYIVNEVKIIAKNDYTNFKEEQNKLILITCTEDEDKRLIVIAYLKNLN